MIDFNFQIFLLLQYLNDIKSISIPDSVVSIGEYAFLGCSELRSITIPDSVVSIDSYAFQGCSELRSIIIPNSVKEIGFLAFGECINLNTITISSDIQKIGRKSLEFCINLRQINVLCKENVDKNEERRILRLLKYGGMPRETVVSFSLEQDMRKTLNDGVLF